MAAHTPPGTHDARLPPDPADRVPPPPPALGTAGDSEPAWTSHDGLALRGRAWRPEPRPLGAVLLVHGLGEHCGRYAHVGRALTGAGFGVLAADLRGHGRSDGPRGHSPSYETLLDDLELLVDQGGSRFPGLPLFLYGHSLGAALVLNLVLRRRPAVRGVVAASPALRLPGGVPRAKVILGRILCRLWPSFRLLSGLDLSGLSRDPEVVRLSTRDPLNHGFVSARLGLDLLAAGEWALEHAREFSLPLLLLHGGADRITSAAATREFAGAVAGDCTCRILPGCYHELHNEPEKAQILDGISAWLRERG